LEQERQGREPVAVELGSGGRGAEVKRVWGLGQGGRVLGPEVLVVSGRGRVDRAAEVKLVWGLGQEGRAPWLEVPVVSGRDLADRVAAACKRPGRGLELATMAAQLWCQEWSLV
jgi:hypothetical protein